MKYLVHITPPENICDRIIALRESLGLTDTTFAPHCSLYTLYANPEHEQQIIAGLLGIKASSFGLQVEGSDFFDDESVVLLVKKDQEVIDLHQKIISQLEGFVSLADVKPYEGEEWRRKIWQKYGSAYVAEGYNPHVTIGHGNCAEIPQFQVSWHVDSFRLFKKDEVWKSVSEFKLQ